MEHTKTQQERMDDFNDHEVMDAILGAKRINFSGLAEAVYVTPEMAELFLKYNTKNRRISKVVNERYARIMESGNWRFNGEPIIFSDRGVLLDGQNRLTAIVRNGMTIPMMIVYGIKEETFSSIDQGSKRTAGQVLNILECKRSNTLAAALRIAYIYFDIDPSLSCSSVPYVHNQALLNFLELHPEIKSSVAKVATGGRLCSSSILAFCHFVFAGKSQKAADLFFKQLLRGEDLHAGHPVLALRSRLFRNRNGRAAISARELIALIFKAWNYCRNAQNIKNLTWHSDDAFPEVI